MRLGLWVGLCAGWLLGAQTAFAGHAHHHEGTPAPIGVMGEHAHGQGDWMFSYRYMRMDMAGNRDGTQRIDDQAVFTDYGFPVTPLRMRMDMHMLGAMYAPTERITLMLMAPYLVSSMDHRVLTGPMAGREFTTESSGLGDVKVSGVFQMVSRERSRVLLNLGLSLPTGSIDERDVTPASAGQAVQLPYPMQLGSGTYDLIPGLTYTDGRGRWDWGAQGLITWRLGENDNRYTLGNRYELNAWGGRDLGAKWSTTARLALSRWGNIDGADPALNPNLVPTADPNRRAGTRADLGLGVSWGGYRGHRLALEWLAPFYQNLDGPQLETDSRILLGWQYGF